jgi:hypothetical protein
MLTPIKVAGIEPAFLVHRRTPVHPNFRSYQPRKPTSHTQGAPASYEKADKRPNTPGMQGSKIPPWRMGDVFLVGGVNETPLLQLNITRVSRLVNL